MTADRLPSPDEAPDATHAGAAPELELDPEQSALYRALASVGDGAAGPELARRYLGAIRVLADHLNPERYAQAAHSLRETMDLLPHAVDVRVEALREKLTNRAVQLEQSWKKAQASGCVTDGAWAGTIDKPLEKFLLEATSFYAWKEEHQLGRRVEFGLTLLELDVTGKPPPKPLQELSIKAWIEIHNYFVRVAHHGADTADFDAWVDALQREILTLLVPRTFDDFTRIDEILGGERG